jgi:hypothetical protein
VDCIQTLPADGIERFLEVEFQHNGSCATTVATAKEFGSVNKIFRDASTFYETSLFRADKVGYMGLQPVCHDFGKGFGKAAL